MSPFDLLHPGVHLSSIMVGSAVGISLERALVLTVFLTVGAFFVFVPLCVRAVTDADGAGTVAVFTALLLVPINGVATHIIAHPTSQTLLIIPLVLFVLLLYLREALGRWWTPSPLGVVLALASVTVVLYHPQEAMSVIIVFWTVALMGFLYRLWSPRHPIATHRSIYVQAAFLTGLFLLWAPRHSRTQSRIVTAYQSIVGVRSPPGVEAAQRAGSVAAIGGSFVELALKLFLVSFVLSLLAGGLMALSLSGRLDDVLPERNAAVRYLTVAFVPLAALTAFVFVGNFGDHYLRFAGFLMVIVTLLSAVALGDVIPALVSRGRLPALRRATLVLFVLLLPLALVSVHPSPWIYQPSQQVTEQTMVGYELAFETRDPDVPFVAIRGSTERFVDAIYGPESATAASFPGARASVPPPVFNTNLTTAYDGARYFPVTDSDRARELQLYAGFRYSSTGFSTLDTSPRSDRVIDTDGFQLYVLTDDDRS